LFFVRGHISYKITLAYERVGVLIRRDTEKNHYCEDFLSLSYSLKKVIRGLQKKYENEFRSQPMIFSNGIYYLTKDLVIKIHNYLIEFFKESDDEITRGIHQVGNIEQDLWAIKDRINLDTGGRRQRIIFKGVHIFYYFLTSHSFVDGNKRIAFSSFLMFLMINNIRFKLSTMGNYLEHAEFIREISAMERNENKEKAIKQLLEWFYTNDEE
jgi:prophage maintenance system killer protein